MAGTTSKGRTSEAKPRAPRTPSRRKAGSDGPGLAKAAIPFVDVTQPNARKALLAMFPHATNDLYVEATPEVEAAAERFLAARARAKAALEEAEIEGNAICAAIGKNLGVRGETFRASWADRDGQVSWKAIAIERGATPADEEKHRGNPTRVLDVDPIVKP